MDKPNNIISFQVPNSFYLTQRDNVNTFTGQLEPNNQCMISAFSMWSLQFGKYANLEKWNSQFNAKTIESVIYTIVQDRVNKLNEKLSKDKQTSRYHSEHFIFVFNAILQDHGWKLVSEKATIDKIIKILNTGQSVVCGSNISSFLKGASGHIQNFVGSYIDLQTKNLLGLISNDPFGDCETGYKNKNGENRYYSLDTMKKLLSPCGKGDTRLMIYAEKIK